MSSLKLFCAAMAALGLGISPITWADIADTDTGFGTTGVTTTDLGSNFDQSGDVFVGANDRIYSVAIDSSSASPAPGTVTKYFIARYSAAGVLDSSFGTGGQITVPVSVLPYAGAVFLAVDEAKQKTYLYVKGPAGCPANGVPCHGEIARFAFAGALDTAWGTNGIVTFATPHNVRPGRLAIQANGTVTAVGTDAGTSADDGFVLRLLYANGAFDPSFNSGHVKLLDFPQGVCDQLTARPAIDANGKIVLFGRTGDRGIGVNGTCSAPTTIQIVLARLNTDGSVDTTFGTNGVTPANVGNADPRDGVVQVGGKIALFYAVSVSAITFGVARFNNNGTLDSTFGTNGRHTQSYVPPPKLSMQGGDDIQSTGEVVIGGTFQTTMTNADAALTRVFGSLELTTTAGTPDTTPPSIPLGLSASAPSATQVNVSWNASTDNVGVTGYDIYRGGVKIGTSATTSYSDTTVSAGTSYSYTVDAYDAAGNISAQSAAASVMTPNNDSGRGGGGGGGGAFDALSLGLLLSARIVAWRRARRIAR